MAGDQYQLRTLGRALAVLNAVSEAPRPLSLSELAVETGTGTTSVFRILKSLEAHGWIERRSDKRYSRTRADHGTSSLPRALKLLQTIAHAAPSGALAQDLVSMTGNPSAEVASDLRQLQGANLVDVTGDRRLIISGGMLTYVRPLLGDRMLDEVLRPVMLELVAAHQETVSWFRRAGWSQVVVEAIPSPHPVRYVLERGSSFPLYAGAAGKAQLAALPPDQVESYLADLRPEALTRHVVEPAKLSEEITVARGRGYATSFGERVEGAASVAVSVRDALGANAGVLGVIVPMFRTSPAQLSHIGEDLVRRTRGFFGPAPRTMDEVGRTG